MTHARVAAPAERRPGSRAGCALAALLLAGAGQFCLNQPESLIGEPALGAALDARFRIELPNPDNVLIALALFCLSALLFGLALPAARPGPPVLPRRPAPPPVRPHALLLIALVLLAALLCGLVLAVLAAGFSHAALAWPWALGLLAALCAALLYDRGSAASLAPALTGADIAIMAGLTLLGAALAAYRLSDVPAFLWPDETPFINRARAIALGLERPAFLDLGVFTFPIASSYYQAAVMRVFGPGLWAWRFSSVIAAMLAVIPTYLLARELFDRRVATISCAVMVSCAFFLTYARLGYNNAQALAPATAAIYGLYAGLRRTSALYSALAGTAAGVGFYTYTGARLGLLVGLLVLLGLLAWQIAQLLRQRGRRLARLLACAGFFGAGWALVALPLLVYVQATSPDRASLKMVETLLSNVDYAGFYLPDENLFRDMPPLQVAGFTLFVRVDLYAYLLVRGLARSFLAFQQAKLLDSHFLVDPLAGSIGAIPYLLGLVVALRNIRQPRMLLILAWFVGGVVALSGIHTWVPRDAHLVPVIPAMCILVALGITGAADSIFRRPAHAQAGGPGRANQLATLATTVLLIGSGAWAYFVTMPRAYVPDLLTAAIRTSLDLQSGQALVYIAHDDGDLRQSDWLRPSIAPGAELIQITAAEAAARPLVLAPGRAYIVFFHAQDAARIRPGLAVATHLALPEQTLYDREGATIGVRAHLQPR